MTTLAKTPLYDVHIAAGAKMVPFAGFEMPVQYAGLRAGTRCRSQGGRIV